MANGSRSQNIFFVVAILLLTSFPECNYLLLFIYQLDDYFLFGCIAGFISPLCLPVGEYATADQTVIGKNGIIAGWGASTSGQ